MRLPVRVPRAGSKPHTAPAGPSVPGLVELLLLVPVLALFVVWGAKDGGYDPVDWLAGALFVLGVVAVLIVAAPRGVTRNRAPLIAAVFLLAFAVWCYASISWAGVRGIAWDGANRTLLYFLVFAVFAWRPVPTRVGFGLLGVFAVAIAIVGGIALARADNVEAAFIAGRFATPITYANANAALFLMAGAPAVVLASRREVHPLARAALFAATGVLAELALLCQSRASLVAVPLTVLVTFALAPRRLALLLVVALVTLPVALAAHRLLDVYPAVISGHGIQARLDDARTAVVWTAVALFAAGLLVALVDRRFVLPRRVVRVLWAVVVVLAIGGIAFGADEFGRRYGSPVREASRAWQHFKAGDSETIAPTELSTHLLSGVASQRYDLWRVALHEFAASPVHGVGVDNYAADYLRLRRTRDEPLYPHSVELRVLAQTGIVGTLLFAGFLVAAFAAVVVGYRRGGSSERALVAACLAAFAYWFLHGSVDWLWEFPALAAPAVAWLGISTRAAEPAPTGETSSRRLERLRYLAVIPALAALASLALPWVAGREVDAATAGWHADANRAFDRLDLAARLNPLDDDAQLVAGVIATRLHQNSRAAAYFRRALARDPAGWFAHLELAALASEAGHRNTALRELSLARSLDPREVAITNTIDVVRRGHHVSPEDIEAYFTARTAVLTGAKQR